MSKDYPVGIDFGACNLKVAHYKHGQPYPLKLNKSQKNDKWTPNVIFYKAQEDSDEVETLIGDAARQSFRKRPEQAANFIDDIKRKLELPHWSHDVPSLGHAVTAQDATHDIFSYIHGVVQKNLDEKRDIEYAITVPVSFSAVQRHRLRAAADSAGLKVRCLLTEPFAAIFSEAVWDKIADEGERQVVVVCDFGGSTIDLSLLEIEPDDDTPVVRELGACGLHYGGRDIDARIESDVLQEKYGTEIAAIETPENRDELAFEVQSVAAHLKETLCLDCEEDEDATEVLSVTGAAHSIHVTFTHEELRAILVADDMEARLKRALDELFLQAGGAVLKSDVTMVKALGGTSLVRPLLDIVSSYFGERNGTKIFDPENEDQFDRYDDEALYFSVAQGAASYLQKQQAEELDLTIENVVPFNIGRLTKKGFVRCLNRGWRTGWGKRKFVAWDEVADEGGKITFYQRLADAASSSTDVYVGSVTVDRAKYKNPKGLAMYLRVQEDDTILVKLKDLRPGEEPFEEVLPVEMGDA